MAEATVSAKHGKNVEFLIKIPGSQWFLDTMNKLQRKKTKIFGEPQTLRRVNNMTRVDQHFLPPPQNFLLFFRFKDDGEEKTPPSV